MDRPTWQCGRCRKPITESDGGYLAFSYDEWHKFLAARDKWETGHTQADGWVAASGTDISRYPSPAHWRQRHYRCVPDISPGVYSIDCERVSTWQEVAHWTAHLWGKQWFADTDWDTLLTLAGARRVDP